MKSETKRLKRIYIFPTAHGIAFLLLIVVMILVAASSGNNLVYGLAFTLFAVYMIAMISTNINLKKITYEGLESEGAHVEELGFLQLNLINPNRKSRFLLRLKARQLKGQPDAELQELPAQSRHMMQVPVRFTQRGVYDSPVMQISTVYPLGLFTAWSHFRLPQKFYVYPKREGQKKINVQIRADGYADLKGSSLGAQQEDFREHSRYIRGESQHQVDWKVMARHGEMLSKRYDTTVSQHYVLTWPMVSHLPHELALSQLALWISELQKTECSFELVLPEISVGRGQGGAHGVLCLRALAEFTGAAS